MPDSNDNPFASPESIDQPLVAPDDVWREGKFLIAPVPGSLPDRCLKCGKSGAERYSLPVTPNPFRGRGALLLAIPVLLIALMPTATQFGIPAWAEPWVVNLSVMALFLVGLLLPNLLGRRLRLEVSLCERHRLWRRVFLLCGGQMIAWLPFVLVFIPQLITPALEAVGYELPVDFSGPWIRDFVPVLFIAIVPIAVLSRFGAIQLAHAGELKGRYKIGGVDKKFLATLPDREPPDPKKGQT